VSILDWLWLFFIISSLQPIIQRWLMAAPKNIAM